MQRSKWPLILLVALAISACQAEKPACTWAEGQQRYLEALPSPSASSAAEPAIVTVAGRERQVDRVVEGPLCDADWSGTVYVACGAQVLRWQDTPLFLKDCDFKVAPGTVVYVAYHNDAAYYNGCSCHTGEIETP